MGADAAALSELAFRSKAHWGYDAAFMETCRGYLTLSAEELDTWPAYIVEIDGRPAGFYVLIVPGDGAAELDDLFVDPTAIGQGVGRRLWEHAVATARAHGCREIGFESDPHAEGFYLAMGAERIGEIASTAAPGRMLPLMRYRVT